MLVHRFVEGPSGAAEFREMQHGIERSNERTVRPRRDEAADAGVHDTHNVVIERSLLARQAGRGEQRKTHRQSFHCSLGDRRHECRQFKCGDRGGHPWTLVLAVERSEFANVPLQLTTEKFNRRNHGNDARR
jgi:hypothetical protein